MSVDMSRYAGMHLHFHTQRHGYGGASYAAARAGECKGWQMGGELKILKEYFDFIFSRDRKFFDTNKRKINK